MTDPDIADIKFETALEQSADFLRARAESLKQNATEDEDLTTAKQMLDLAARLDLERWEPYDPCPVCGSDEHFGESLVMSSPIDVDREGSGLPYPVYTNETYGQTIVLDCHNCETRLVDNRDEVSVR